MKKTLLAAALLTGYAGAAMAQNSVTLFGIVSTGPIYQSVNLSDKAAATLGVRSDSYNQVSMREGVMGAGTRLGARGIEDLGGGLKAGFQIEFRNVGTANDNNLQRSNLFLQNDSWGTLRLGRQDLPNGALTSGLNPLGTGYGVGAPTQAGFGVMSFAPSSGIAYTSPNFNGFTAAAGYSFNVGTITSAPALGADGFGTTQKNTGAMAGIRYANGPVVLSAVYQQLFPKYNARNASPKTWMIGGAYDLKVVRLHAGYSQNIDGVIGASPDSGFTGIGLTTAQLGNIPGRTSVLAGARLNSYFAAVSAPIGAAGSLAVSFGQAMPSGTLDTAETATQTNLGVVYNYKMSPRTTAYAFYSYANNYFLVDGAKVNQIGVGLQHTF